MSNQSKEVQQLVAWRKTNMTWKHPIAAVLIVISVALPISAKLKAQEVDHRPVKIIGLDAEKHLADKINLKNVPEIVAHELKYLLEKEGYILATPKITGEQEITVSYGAIKNVAISGFSENVTAKIEAYFSQASTEKPRIGDIDTALALINDMPGVVATVAFKKLDDNGNFEAVVTGVEQRQSGQVVYDNTSRTIGRDNRFQLFQNFNSVFTGGDLIRLQGSFVDAEDSPNQRSVFGSYTYPLTLSGTYVEVSAGDFQTEVPVEGSSSVVTTNTGFSILPGAVSRHDFEGQSASVTVGHPFIRTHGQAAYVLGSLDWSDDETETVGDTENISGDVSVFYRHERSDGKSYAVGTTLGVGHTDSYNTGDTGNFGYLQGSLGAIAPVEAIAPHTEVRFELFVQLGTKDTPSAKMMGLGSEEFLRGYENSTFVGTSGVRGSFEIAHAFYPANSIANAVTPYAFLDAGAVKNDSAKATSTSRPKSDTLASTGVGVRMALFDRASVEGFVGLPLLENATGKTPAPRVYMRLSWGW